uniref:Uncharacterized protein n=1 Tax=Anopheles minimus TaxID=112268 RepID=A0A182W7D4_9DIPT
MFFARETPSRTRHQPQSWRIKTDLVFNVRLLVAVLNSTMNYLCVCSVILVLIAQNLAVTPTGKVDFSEADDLNDDTLGGGFVSVYKNYPKIQVTVDTQKLKRVPQPETKSDESSSGSSGSSGSESVERPSVGVRTDITIEISEEAANDARTGDRDGKKDRNGPGGLGAGEIGSGKKDRNGNGKTADEDDANASIPVFKGMAGVSTKKPKPTPSRGTPHGDRPGITLSQRPTVTSFYGPGSDDRNRISGEYDGWNSHYPPHTVTAVWTTERPYLRRVDYDYSGQHRSPTYYKGYVPYNVGHHHTQSAEHHHAGDWKPCYCSIYQPWAARAPSNPVLPSTGPLHPTVHPPPPRNTVDNKVDVPAVLSHHQQHYRSIRS